MLGLPQPRHKGTGYPSNLLTHLLTYLVGVGRAEGCHRHGCALQVEVGQLAHVRPHELIAVDVDDALHLEGEEGSGLGSG